MPWLTDRKWAHIRLEGKAFGDVPLNVELKLEVWDSPNSAGVVIDAVRLIKLALNNGIAGQLDGPSSYLMKSPHTQRPDDEAREQTEEFIAANARGKAAKSVRGRRRGDEDRGLGKEPAQAGSYARPYVSAERLSIVQVTPLPAGHREPDQPVRRARLGGAARAAATEVRIAGIGDRSRSCCAATPSDVVHVHEPFAPRVSSAALRHSSALNVATFHAPQERVLSTQVARPLVEIFFGRIDARTVTTPETGELLERYFPASYELLEPGGPDRDWSTVADELEAIYRRLAARRHDPDGDPEIRGAASPSAR